MKLYYTEYLKQFLESIVFLNFIIYTKRIGDDIPFLYSITGIKLRDMNVFSLIFFIKYEQNTSNKIILNNLDQGHS